MNLKEKHSAEKPVSAIALFTGEGAATALQILKGQQLKAHITYVPALLICVTGKVVFENEDGIKVTLLPADYVAIEPMSTHWVDGLEDSQLILLK